MQSRMPMMVMALILIVAFVFAGSGVKMHLDVAGEEAVFHAAQSDYLTNNSKADRDAAPAGSPLSQLQAEVANYPSTLLFLKLVGVGRILTGIFFLLLGILMALVMMPIRLGKIVSQAQ